MSGQCRARTSNKQVFLAGWNAMPEKSRTKLRSIHSTKTSRSGMVICFRSQTVSVANSKPATSGPTNVLLYCSTIRSNISPLEIDNVIRQIPGVADVATGSVLNNIHCTQVVVDTSRKKVAGYRRMPCWNVAVRFSPISRCRTKLSSATHSPTRSVARWIVTPDQISGRQNTRPHSQAA